MGSHY